MAQRVHLNHQADWQAIDLAQLDETIEDGLPFLVTGEIVVGQKEAGDAFLQIFADHPLHVVGRTRAGFAPLHVDDGAERALKRAAAAGVEAAAPSGGPPHKFDRQERTCLTLHVDEIAHEVVLRLEPAGGGVLQQRVQTAFELAGENGDAEFAREIEIDGGAVEHRDAAGNVKAADHDRNAVLAERTREIERARVLIALHADQRDHAEPVGFAKLAEQLANVDAGVGLVDHVDDDVDIRAEHPALRAIQNDAVNRGERVRRNETAPPADDVTVVVIVRRLDKHHVESPVRHRCSVTVGRATAVPKTILPDEGRFGK